MKPNTLERDRVAVQDALNLLYVVKNFQFFNGDCIANPHEAVKGVCDIMPDLETCLAKIVELDTLLKGATCKQ